MRLLLGLRAGLPGGAGAHGGGRRGAAEANHVTRAGGAPAGQALREAGDGAGGARSWSKLELTGCELSLSLVGDRAIRRLNRTWRKKDKATDVLSFPAGDAAQGHARAAAARGRGHLAGHGEAAGQGVRAARWRRRWRATWRTACCTCWGTTTSGPRTRRRWRAPRRQLLGESGMVGGRGAGRAGPGGSVLTAPRDGRASSADPRAPCRSAAGSLAAHRWPSRCVGRRA